MAILAEENKLWINGRDGWYVAAWGNQAHIDWYAEHYKKSGYETATGWHKPSTQAAG